MFDLSTFPLIFIISSDSPKSTISPYIYIYIYMLRPDIELWREREGEREWEKDREKEREMDLNKIWQYLILVFKHILKQ